ncbi:MAG: hypothetical protein ACTTKZ_01370 [Bacteroides sp.]
MKMRIMLLLSAILGSSLLMAQSGETGEVLLENRLGSTFNYQALITKSGQVVSESNVKLEVTLQDAKPTIYLVEEHTARTTKTGMVTLAIGTGKVKQGKLDDVAWSKGIFISLRADFGNGYQSLGSPVKLQAVPYAMHARTVPIIKGLGDTERPIFQVQNSDGFPLFTVYENEVTVNVPDDEESVRRPRGGFAVRSYKLSDDGSSIFNNRLEFNNGGFNINIDPELRGLRGGFAVRSVARLRGGETENKTLFSANDRSTYFTLSKATSSMQASTFQLRKRKDVSSVVMSITKDGTIETGLDNNTSDTKVLQPMKPSSNNFQVIWSWLSDTATHLPTVIDFTNLVRCRYPQLLENLNAIPDEPYEIIIHDEPSGAKLSDYVQVGEIQISRTKKVLGLVLRSDVDLTKKELPAGRVEVVSLARPEMRFIAKTSKVKDEAGVDVTKLGDKLEIEGACLNNLFTSARSFIVELKAKAITWGADFERLYWNLPMQYTVRSGELRDLLQIEKSQRGAQLVISTTNDAAFKQYLERVKASGGKFMLPLRLTFPTGIYKTLDFDVQITVE